MIGYIVREVAGWLLVALGLWFFYVSASMLMQSPARILSAPPVALIGFVIFRGGIHLLKVAVAARAAQQARRDLVEAARRSRLPQPRVAPAKK